MSLMTIIPICVCLFDHVDVLIVFVFYSSLILIVLYCILYHVVLPLRVVGDE